MKCFFPVISPIKFVKEAVEGISWKLNKAQTKNLLLMVSAIFLCQSMCISTIVTSLLGTVSKTALSHFFSYARLDGYVLMQNAVSWAINRMGLQMARFRIAIDDTMKHHSKGCRKIANVYWLFDHVLGTCCKAKCIVFAYVVISERIRFPIGWRVYKKDGPKKWELALELIDDILKYKVQIGVVLFDSWFCVKGFIKGIEKRKLCFIGDMKSNRIGEYTEQDSQKNVSLSFAKLFESGKCLIKEIILGLKSNNAERAVKALYKTYSTVARVKAFDGKYLIVKSVDLRTNAIKIFVCNNLNWDAKKVLEEYSFRWIIEEFFANAKGLCGLEEACIRSEQGGAIALFLVSFVDLLISLELLKVVHNDSKGKLQTVSAIFATVAEENLENLLESQLENPDKFQKIIEGWLELTKKKKNQSRRERKVLIEISEQIFQNDSINAALDDRKDQLAEAI